MTPEQMAALFGRNSRRTSQTQGARYPEQRRRAPPASTPGSGMTLDHPESGVSGQGGGGGRGGLEDITAEALGQPTIFDPEEAMRYMSLFDIIGDAVRIPSEQAGWLKTRAEEDLGGERAQALAQELGANPAFGRYQNILSQEEGMLSPQMPGMLSEDEIGSMLGGADQIAGQRGQLAQQLISEYPGASEAFLQAAARGNNLPPLGIPEDMRDPVGLGDIGEGIQGFLEGGAYEPQSGAGLVERLAYEGVLEPPVTRFLQLAAMRRAAMAAQEAAPKVGQEILDAWNDYRGSPDLPPHMRVGQPATRQRARQTQRAQPTTTQPGYLRPPQPRHLDPTFVQQLSRPRMQRFWSDKHRGPGRRFDLAYAHSLHPELRASDVEKAVIASEEAGEPFLPWLQQRSAGELERLGLNSRDANILVQNAQDLPHGVPDLALAPMRDEARELTQHGGGIIPIQPYNIILNKVAPFSQAERAGELATDLRISEEAAQGLIDRAVEARNAFTGSSLEGTAEGVARDPLMFSDDAMAARAQRDRNLQQHVAEGGEPLPPRGSGDELMRRLREEPDSLEPEPRDPNKLNFAAGGDRYLDSMSEEFRQALDEAEAKQPQGGREGSDAPNMVGAGDESTPLVDESRRMTPSEPDPLLEGLPGEPPAPDVGVLGRLEGQLADLLSNIGRRPGGDDDEMLRLFKGMTDEDAALTFNQIADEGAPLAQGAPRRVSREAMDNVQNLAQENALRATSPESQRRWVLLGREMNNLPPRPEAEQVMETARRLGFNPEELENLKLQFTAPPTPVFQPGELTGQAEAADALGQARIRSGGQLLDEAVEPGAVPSPALAPRTVGLDTDEGVDLADRWRLASESEPFAKFVDDLHGQARGKRVGALSGEELENLGSDTLMGGQIDTDGFGPTKFAVEGSEGAPELVRVLELPSAPGPGDVMEGMSPDDFLEETLAPIMDAAGSAAVPVELVGPYEDFADALFSMGFRKRQEAPVWYFDPHAEASGSAVTYLSQRSA